MDLIPTMRELERTWNHKFNYPWTFFNDVPFTEEFKRLTKAETKAECFYHTIPREHWATPSWISRELFEESVRILEENNPQLDGIDGGKLAVDRDYQSQDPAAALKDFETARRASLQILRDVSPAELERQCSLEGFSGLTLAGLAQQMRAHDAGHLAELEALREQLLQAQEAVAIRIQ